MSHIYVEPHYDDVALSVGGTVARQSAAGERVLVLTVFSGGPASAGEITEFAAGQHSRWGGATDPNADRRDEQIRAMAILGAEWLPLGFPDAIYRADQYLSDGELFGDPKPGDQALVGQILRAIEDVVAESGHARVYAPLTVGHHVDHILALAAVRGFDPILYEDFPYARQPSALAEAVMRVAATADMEVDITDVIDRRIAAIGAYRSQIPTLFGDVDAMKRETRRFAQGSSGRVIERFWRLTPAIGRERGVER